jgi:DNA adenine methylase
MLFERDPLLFSFWYSVFNRHEELIGLIQKYPADLYTRAELDWLRHLDCVDNDVVLMGFAGLLFNRTSFSGVLHAGPIGGVGQQSKYKVDCRYNKGVIIAKIRACAEYADRVTVHFGDALKVLNDASSSDYAGHLFYIDPPYYVQGPKLYRYHYIFSDHLKLAEVLGAAKYSWILSYDDHPAIRHLYRRYDVFEPNLRYSTKVPKIERELILTNIKDKSSEFEPKSNIVKPTSRTIESTRDVGYSATQTDTS